MLSFMINALDLQFFATVLLASTSKLTSGFPLLSKGVGTANTITSDSEIKVGSKVGLFQSLRFYSRGKQAYNLTRLDNQSL